MKTVLITGVYGFLGSHTAAKFKQEGWRVIGLGRGKELPKLLQEYPPDTLITGEVNQKNLSQINEPLDVLIHFAGNGVVSRSFEDPLKDFRDSVECSVEVLDYMRRVHPQGRFIFSSGATVYGKQDDVLLREDMTLYPTSPYGVHKKITEELCEMYSKTYDLGITVIRFFSLYGPGLKKQLLYDACKKLSDPASVAATFWGTGNETRDWFNIDDAVGLVYTAAQTIERFSLMNAGSGIKITLKETIEYIKKELESSKEIVFTGEGRVGDPQHFWANIEKAKELGWKPQIFWKEGIRTYVDWFKKQNI